MKRIIPLVKTIEVNQDNFNSDFKNTKLVWNSFDEPLVAIESNNAKISNLNLHVKTNNKSPVIVIGNTTKMVTNITMTNVTISCKSDVVHITNAKDITFSKCIFKSNDIRTSIFVLSEVYNIRFENCILDGGNISFQLNDTTAGYISKCKISNSDFLFSFGSDSKSNWKVIDNNFHNIQHMIANNYKVGSNNFITSNNRFHSSNSEGLLNNLKQYNQELVSRDIFGDIGGVFGIGGGGDSGGSSGGTSPIGGTSLLGKSFSISQILIFITVGFVLLIIIILIIVFAIKLAKGA